MFAVPDVDAAADFTAVLGSAFHLLSLLEEIGVNTTGMVVNVSEAVMEEHFDEEAGLNVALIVVPVVVALLLSALVVVLHIRRRRSAAISPELKYALAAAELMKWDGAEIIEINTGNKPAGVLQVPSVTVLAAAVFVPFCGPRGLPLPFASTASIAAAHRALQVQVRWTPLTPADTTAAGGELSSIGPLSSGQPGELGSIDQVPSQ